MGGVLEVGGSDMGVGECVCVVLVCGRWADTKGYKEMRY
jgi:hypothetical protein